MSTETMTDADTDSTDEAHSKIRRLILGIGGVLSLCCVFVAPAATGAVGITATGGTTAALGGGFVEILVSAVTGGVIAIVARIWANLRTSEEEF